MEESSTSDGSGPANPTLGALLTRVHDRDTFLDFVSALLDDYDRYKADVASSGLPYAPWENGTDFGENLSACLN